MEQRVKVLEALADGSARVQLVRQSACSGDCHQCAGCGAAEETLVFLAENPIGAKAGDVVWVEAPSGPVLTGAAVLYLVPLGLFFGGYALGDVLWKRGGLVGCLAFLLGLAGAVVYDRLAAGKRKTTYVIVRTVG